MTLMCCSISCTEPAAEALQFRGQPGHVHDCPAHAARVREWCDVIHSAPIIDGECPAPDCTGNDVVGVGMPTPLRPAP